MSIKNRSKDRNKAGRIDRKYTGPYVVNFKTPSWWVNLRMTRPARRTDKILCQKIQRELISSEGISFTLGNRKPHDYYW